MRSLDRIDKLLLAHGMVIEIECGVEQFAHSRFDCIWQLAGNDNQGLVARH